MRRKMPTPEPEGSATGIEAAERAQEERYSSESWIRSNRAHPDMTAAMHLAARHIDWASQSIGGALYMHTLWILKWKGRFTGRDKINRRSQVEAELGISIGRSRGGGGGIKY